MHLEIVALDEMPPGLLRHRLEWKLSQKKTLDEYLKARQEGNGESLVKASTPHSKTAVEPEVER